MTVVEFMISNGFRRARIVDVKPDRRYVKRHTASYLEQELLVAGGHRKGQHYVLMPSWESTAYCCRYYLKFE